MMLPADRIQEDPGQEDKENPPDHDDDFLAVGPALRILQLNVEGLSAAKRSVIGSIAAQHAADIICLQETHVESDVANRFSIAGFDLVSHTLHPKHGRATYVRSDIADACHTMSSEIYDGCR